MKKTFIYVLAAASLFTASQVQAQKEFSLSVKGTPQFSFMQNKTDNDNSAYERKATFNAGFGIGGGYNFTTNSGIGLDALYSLQGQRYTLNGTEYNQKMQYVKIPLMYTYNTDQSKAVSFVGKIGPQLSILTTSKLTDKDGNDLISDTKSNYKSATFGGVVLAGTQFKLAQRTFLTTGVRFDYDFTNAEDDALASHTNGRDNTYHSTVGLEVGLKFLLK